MSLAVRLSERAARVSSTAVLPLLAFLPAPARAQAPVAVTHVTVIDATGAAPRRDATVILRDGRIAAVGADGSVGIPAGARVVDGSGKFLVPGLWDMHVHLEPATAAALPVLVALGVTSVRDLSTPLRTVAPWRAEIARGARVGPRIVAGGGVLDGPDHRSPDRIPVSSAADARRVVDSLKGAGAEFIKLYEFLPRDAYFAALDQGRRRGLPVVGRVPRSVRLQESVEAGLRTFERWSGVPLPCSFAMRLVARAPGLGDVVPPCGSDGDRDRAFAALTSRPLWATPTLVSFAKFRTGPDQTQLRHAAPALRAAWEQKLAKWPKAVPTSFRRDLIKLFLPTTQQAQRAGVRMIVGTDLGSPYVVPGWSVHEELELLVQAGLTPLAALQAATRNAAQAAGLAESAGTIEAGKQADLLLLDADPLADIRNTRKIQAVVLRGRVLDRAALDGMLR